MSAPGKTRQLLLAGKAVSSNGVRGVARGTVSQAARKLEEAGYEIERERGEDRHVTYRIVSGPDFKPAARGRRRAKAKVPAGRDTSSRPRRARGSGDSTPAGSLAPPLGATMSVGMSWLDGEGNVHLVLRNGSESYQVRLEALAGAGAR